MDTLEDIHDLIEVSIHNNPPVSVKDGGIIRKDIMKNLSELRLISKKANLVASLEDKERQETA